MYYWCCVFSDTTTNKRGSCDNYRMTNNVFVRNVIEISHIPVSTILNVVEVISRNVHELPGTFTIFILSNFYAI